MRRHAKRQVPPPPSRAALPPPPLPHTPHPAGGRRLSSPWSLAPSPGGQTRWATPSSGPSPQHSMATRDGSSPPATPPTRTVGCTAPSSLTCSTTGPAAAPASARATGYVAGCGGRRPASRCGGRGCWARCTAPGLLLRAARCGVAAVCMAWPGLEGLHCGVGLGCSAWTDLPAVCGVQRATHARCM